MTTPDYEDHATENRWCADRRAQVADYLAEEGVAHGQIGEWPAWHIAPVVSVWAIESKRKTGWVGWWVICGDLPTDYVSAATIKHPRKAVEAFARRWQQHCETTRAGASDPELSIGRGQTTPTELIPLLASRAATLASWAQDDTLWEDL